MQTLARAFIVMWGWRRAATAFGAGAISIFALAPFNFFPVLFLSFPILVWLIDGVGTGQNSVARSRFNSVVADLVSAATLGWFFGFGFFLAGLYWIGVAFLVEAEKFAFLMPFAVVLLPAGLALFHAFAVMLAHLLWTRGPLRIVALAVGLAIGEWLRGHILTGFPWNLIGYALTGYDNILQSVALIGIDGLTFVTIFVCASPAALGTLQVASLRHRAVPAVISLIVMISLGIYGFNRIPDAPLEYANDIRLRIVQPNVAQSEKWKPENRSAIFSRLLTMSDGATSPETAGVRDVTHVIWPETAVPFLLTEAPDARAAIAAMLPLGTTLITGTVRREFADSENETAATAMYNSILVFDDADRISAIYDKVHLVPFGEYLPFHDLLSRMGLSQLTRMRPGFGAGEGRRTYSVANTPGFAPLICYEIIFSGAIVSQEARPGWILNLTNDAWYGDSTGPYQHFQQTRVRAVEEGLPVVRAANTGISAVIGPYGRILEHLPINVAGVIDSRLPVALAPTFFARHGSAALIILLGLGLVVCIIGKYHGSKNRQYVAT